MAERELHIKQRHPEAYDLIMRNLKDIVENPDATFSENGKQDTVWAIKNIEGENARVILKISTAKGIPGYKNSVLTGQLITEKRLEKELRKNRITRVYKSKK